ncbi:Ig-like domain-containing protein [Catenulispora sp. GP43]|uniref:Ig-like domain-containing protein n=1 Tax=Catenulispora sp. GP43 TaxID=3156263 RepID=UPI003514449B
MSALVAFASPAVAQVTSSTSVVAVPSSAATGQAVDLNATVTCAGDPSGGLGMTFFDGGTLLTTVPVAADGTATYATSFTTTGTHTITAAYNGNDNCDASNSTTTVDVTSTPAPTPTPPGLCLLVCGSLVSVNVEDNYTYNIHNTYNIYDIHNTYNVRNGGGESGGPHKH